MATSAPQPSRVRVGSTLPGNPSAPSRLCAPHCLSPVHLASAGHPAPAQPHTWAQAHEQEVECSSGSHVSRFGASSAWAGIPVAGGCRPAAVGVWGQVEGRGAEGPDAARGWQEGAASALLGSSRSYFYRREGAWSPPWGGVPGALISRVTKSGLPRHHPALPQALPYPERGAGRPAGLVIRHLLNFHFLLAPSSG